MPAWLWVVVLGATGQFLQRGTGPVVLRRAGVVAAYAWSVFLRGGVLLGGSAALVLGGFVRGSGEFWLAVCVVYWGLMGLELLRVLTPKPTVSRSL